MRVPCQAHDKLDCSQCFPFTLTLAVFAWRTERALTLETLAKEIDQAIGDTSTGCVQLEVRGPFIVGGRA